LKYKLQYMSEFLKPEKYSLEFQTAVEERQKRPLIDVKTIKRKNEQGEEEEINVVDIAGVTIESLASREDIEKVIATIHKTKDTLEILQACALLFQQKRGLIVEGRTGGSKTFSFNRFTELIFGWGVKPVDFYCNGQTDTMSLMAKWVPRTEDPEDQKAWEEYTSSPEGRKAMQDIIESVKAGITDPKEIQDMFISLAKKAGITKPISQWQFQYGALPRAMTMPKDPTKPISPENPPRGNFLHVQEPNLAEINVIDALLQLGGEKGRLAGEIQLWEDGGKRVQAGPYFWIYYSTNPPENYPNRQGIDQALARRNTFFKLGAESPVSRQLKQYQDNNIPYENLPANLRREIEKEQKGIIFPLEIEEGGRYDSPEYLEVRLLISEVISDFHEKLRVAMAEKSIEQRVKQKFELTDDEWNMVYDFMRHFRSPDLEATLDRAVFLHYVSRFTDKGKEEAWKLWEQVKSNKDFKKRLEAALPKEKSIEEIEAISELKEFEKLFDQDLQYLEKDIEDFCQSEIQT